MCALDPLERDLVKCADMRIQAERALKFLDKNSLQDFLANEMLQCAVVRCVEIIGEAARLVSPPTQQRAPEIPWSLIIGMRNILAHDYGAVDYEKIYEVVIHSIPPLLSSINSLIAVLEKMVGWNPNENTEK